MYILIYHGWELYQLLAIWGINDGLLDLHDNMKAVKKVV